MIETGLASAYGIRNGWCLVWGKQGKASRINGVEPT